MIFVEVFGYIASLTVAVSLMLKTIIRLRVVNMAGAILLVIYCIIVRAYPLMFLNAFIACVNGVYRWQYYHKKEYFRLSELKMDSAFL